MRIPCLTVFLLLTALVCTGSCNVFDESGFVEPPRHRGLRSSEDALGSKQSTKPATVKPVDTTRADTEDISIKLSTTLPEPEEPVAETPLKDPHIKIVVHSTSNCPYCVRILNTLKAFEDKYEIVEEKHDGRFKPTYSRYYVTRFPYIEYLYDGKVKLYHYGSRTENQIKNYIEQIK